MEEKEKKKEKENKREKLKEREKNIARNEICQTTIPHIHRDEYNCLVWMAYGCRSSILRIMLVSIL